jgi:O-antigen ligase
LISAGFIAALLAAAVAGWAATQSTLVMGGVAGICLFAAALAIPLSLRESRVIPSARVIAWIGLIAPLTFSEQHSAADVLQQGATPTTLAQGAIGCGSLLLVLLIARPSLIPFRRHEKWLGLYAGIALISTTWSVATTPTLLKAIQLVVAFALVVCLVRLTEPVQLFRHAFVVFQLVVLSTIVGLLASPHQAFQPNTLHVSRLRGALIQVSPDLLGVVAAVACLWAIARVGPRVTRGWFITTLLVSLDVTLLLLSRSRTGVGALAIGLVVLMLQGRRRVLGLLMLPIVATIAAGVLAGNVGGTVTYLQRDQSNKDITTLTGRTNNWSDAFRMWKHHPLQGFGYYAGHRLAAVASETAHAPQNLDNMWIETLQNLGLLGLIPLAAFVILSGISLFRARGRSPALTAARAAFAALLFASFLNPSLQKPSYVMVLFLIVLLVDPFGLGASRRGSQERMPPDTSAAPLP